MDQHRRVSGCWWILLVLGVIGSIIFSLIFIVPYPGQKSWIDSLAGDGDIESFTIQVFNVARPINLSISNFVDQSLSVPSCLPHTVIFQYSKTIKLVE